MTAPSTLPGFPDGEHRAIGSDAKGEFAQYCRCLMGRDHALGARGSLAVAREVVQSGPRAWSSRPLVGLKPGSVTPPEKGAQSRTQALARELIRRKQSPGTGAANVARARAAAREAAERATERLAAGGLPARHEASLRLRADHPELSYAELGALAGMSKDAMAARVRRALEHPVPGEGREAS